MTYTSAELGWLAGIIDGEGTVGLSHGGNRSPHLRVMIYNSDDRILVKVRAILDALGVAFYEKRDTRAPRHSSNILIGTAGSFILHAKVRPFMVRQVVRYDAAVEFLQPCYEGRSRVHWTTAQRAEWEALRLRFNAA